MITEPNNIYKNFVCYSAESRPQIVYPPSELDQIHYHYTQEEIHRNRVEINLCLIEPYTPQRTVSSVKYRKGNKTHTAYAGSSAVLLAVWRPGLSAVLDSKVLTGPTTGLVYFISIRSVLEDMADVNSVLAFFQNRLGTGRFTCSVGGRNKVTFKLNLTQLEHVKDKDKGEFS